MYVKVFYLLIYIEVINIAIKIRKRYQGRTREINRDIINESISAKELLVITADGEKLGVISREVALKKAEDAELDLVLIAPNSTPPVGKIVDYGKYKYEKKKAEQAAKRNQKVVELKEIRITPNIGQHDLETKLKNGRKFLKNGDKLKISLKFRGRENLNKDFGAKTLKRAVDMIKDVSDIEKPPKESGRFLDVILKPKK